MKNSKFIYRYYLLGILMLVFFSCSQGNDRDKINKEKKSGFVGAFFDSGQENINSDIYVLKLDDMPDREILSEALQEKLDTVGLDPFFPNNKEKIELEDKLKGFYEEHDHQIVWISEKGITEQANDLLDAIHTVNEEGLNPEHYNLEKFQDLFNEINEGSQNQPDAIVELDLLFTSSFLVLASDMSSGRLNPYKFENSWIPSVPEKDLKEVLIEAYESNSIKESLDALAPDHPQYDGLKQALAQYKAMAEAHSWEALEIDSVIQKGDSGSIVLEIKQRLKLLKDFEKEKEGENEAVFDEDMETAVKSFQARHDLEADGILGPDTYKMLNIPLEDKINQIKLNLERVRWLPRDLGEEYILVNVPEFKLRIYENDDVIDEMKVIVGKEFNSTPIFSDTLEYLSFSPTWTVPVSILQESLLEDIVKDPGYLERNHYEVYEDWNEDSEPIDPYSINWEELEEEEINFRLVQKPGPWNALGQVKFMMPNNMAIYLHDTPTENLFDSQERSYSHGCVRVERPLDLTEFLLKDDPSWNRSKIMQYLNLDEPEDVILPKKIPVHIVYKTTWVDEEGKIHFLSDIYNHDEIQLASLEKSLNLD